jgi:hypothetical protein
LNNEAANGKPVEVTPDPTAVANCLNCMQSVGDL